MLRIIAACRDGKVYNIKDGDIRGTAVLTGNVIDAGSQVVALAKQDKVQCYHSVHLLHMSLTTLSANMGGYNGQNHIMLHD